VEEVGVAGQGVVGLAVNEEANGGDLRKGGVEGADDRLHGEGFYLDAGGMVVDERAAEVDDGQLAGLAGRWLRGRLWIGEEKDVVDRGSALQRVGRLGERVGGEKVFEESAGADGGLLGKSE
jgi:hypothetical protein